MLYIYSYINKLNGKRYIGQTNDMRLRYNGHKSDAYNPNSHCYNSPLSRAIRKYGLKNFDYILLEEVETREQANEREVYWINYYKSQITTENKNGGYNLTAGGDGTNRMKVPFEVLITKSKLLTAEEILDIQFRLVNQETYESILEDYPQVNASFLSNINNGYNFLNPNLTYPLKTDFTHEHCTYTEKQIKEIKELIKQDVPYSKISELYGISVGYISGINSGKKYYDENETYPLKQKICADKSWIKEALYLLIFTNIPIIEIGKKVGRQKGAMTKLNNGNANKQDKFIYPIRYNKKKNAKIFKEVYGLDNIVSTISS